MKNDGRLPRAAARHLLVNTMHSKARLIGTLIMFTTAVSCGNDRSGSFDEKADDGIEASLAVGKEILASENETSEVDSTPVSSEKYDINSSMNGPRVTRSVRVCRIRGSSPFCNAKCKKSYAEKEYPPDYCMIPRCLSGSKFRCCVWKTVSVPEDWVYRCEVRGTSPFCSGSCGRYESQLATTTMPLLLGQQPACGLTGYEVPPNAFGQNCTTGTKSYCCGYMPPL